MSYQLTPNRPQILQSGSTAVGAGGILLVKGHCERLTLCVEGTGVIASGTILIEEAFYDEVLLADGSKTPEPPFAGTWSLLATVAAVDLTGGAQIIFHVQGSIWAIRARISVVIAGGGTIRVVAWGN